MEQILIFSRRPYIWNNILSPEKKQFTAMHKYKAMTKSTLFFLENELIFFYRVGPLFYIRI